MADSNHITKIAIQLPVKAAKAPNGVTVKEIDYNAPNTILEALRGHQVLIITLSGAVAPGTEEKLIHAAADADVPFILPSDFAPDTTHESLYSGVPVFEARVELRKLIEKLGKSSWISVINGFWYEYCLAMPAAFGFDFAKKEVTLFDEGDTKVSLSTWPQIGKAVAALMSLPTRAEGGGACLEQLRNKPVFINSFTISQRDILAAALRVTETKEDGWTINKVPSQERIATGREEMQEGNRAAFAKVFFTKLFLPGMGGDFEHDKGTMNAVLGLKEENLDAPTRGAIERSKTRQWTDE